MTTTNAPSPARRRFLKGIFAGAVVSAQATLPGVPLASAQTATPSPVEDYATLIDISACVGCNACVEACHQRNGARYPNPVKPFPVMYPPATKVEDWSDKRDADDRLTPYNWLYIQPATVHLNGTEQELYVPRRCLHCVNPPCANLCPWGSARKEATGTVSIDAATCLGGAKCRTVCPWSIPQRQTGVGLYLELMPRFAGNGVMYKCDRCADTVATGGTPACIEACPNNVQTIGPRKAIIAQARQLAAARGGYLYGVDENGGTNTIYLSPVPFDVLDKAITKGPGKPHLAPVADSMRDQTVLATALVTAPLAGIGAGLLHIYRTMRCNASLPLQPTRTAVQAATASDVTATHTPTRTTTAAKETDNDR